MRYIQKLKFFKPLFIPFITCFLVYILVSIFFKIFGYNLNSEIYLTWHNIVEILCISTGLSIFSIAYFTYKQTHIISTILIGQIFLLSSIMDLFHAMSFKGMPLFFIENNTPNRTVTFWVISRLIMAFGLFIILFYANKTNLRINENRITLVIVLFAIIILYLVTYKIHIFPVLFKDKIGATDIKIYLEYLIMAIFLITIIKLSLSNSFSHSKNHFSIALLLLIFSEYSFVQFKDLYDMNNFIGHVYKIIAYAIFFNGLFITSFNKPFNDLKNYIANSEKIIAKRTQDLKTYNDKLLMDLNFARNIQHSLLPDNKKMFNSIKFYSNYMAADNLSGDYYNYFLVDNKNLIFFVSDVSGHGSSAAMLTVYLNQCIKSAIEKLKPDISPAKILNYVYEEYNSTNFDHEVYILLFFCMYNYETSLLSYSSAGLNAEPIYITSSGECIKILIDGFPICKLIDIYKPTYTDYEIKVKPNDKLFMYTDGLSESKNINGEIYTDVRIYDIIKKNSLSGGEKIFNYLTEDIYIFLGNESRIEDDITYLIAEFK